MYVTERAHTDHTHGAHCLMQMPACAQNASNRTSTADTADCNSLATCQPSCGPYVSPPVESPACARSATAGASTSTYHSGLYASIDRGGHATAACCRPATTTTHRLMAAVTVRCAHLGARLPLQLGWPGAVPSSRLPSAPLRLAALRPSSSPRSPPPLHPPTSRLRPLSASPPLRLAALRLSASQPAPLRLAGTLPSIASFWRLAFLGRWVSWLTHNFTFRAEGRLGWYEEMTGKCEVFSCYECFSLNSGDME